MPDNRSRLHLSKLNDFAAFAESRGYRREPTKGGYEILRLQRQSETPLIYFFRGGCEHATAPRGKAAELVNAWLREKRAREEEARA
jgi:hypothetical protein